jgi:hypothetical protein
MQNLYAIELSLHGTLWILKSYNMQDPSLGYIKKCYDHAERGECTTNELFASDCFEETTEIPDRALQVT